MVEVGYYGPQGDKVSPPFKLSPLNGEKASNLDWTPERNDALKGPMFDGGERGHTTFIIASATPAFEGKGRPIVKPNTLVGEVIHTIPLAPNGGEIVASAMQATGDIRDGVTRRMANVGGQYNFLDTPNFSIGLGISYQPALNSDNPGADSLTGVEVRFRPRESSGINLEIGKPGFETPVFKGGQHYHPNHKIRITNLAHPIKPDKFFVKRTARYDQAEDFIGPRQESKITWPDIKKESTKQVFVAPPPVKPPTFPPQS